MELTFVGKKVELNPELEALRIKGLKENALETNDWILQMISRTSRIHAGFLFEDRKTLQNLCLFISETQNKITDAGWEAFGYYLGLSPSAIKVINHNNFNREDPCYNVLLAYIQYENASVGKIIKALHDMGRMDVLSRIQHSINNLADIVLQCYITNVNTNLIEGTSDYGSLTSCEGNTGSNNIGRSNTELLSNVLIKPKVIPPAPFIFQNIQTTPELSSQQIHQAVSNALLNVFSNSNKQKLRNNQNISGKISCIDDIYESHKLKLVTENVQTRNVISCDNKNFETPKKKNYGLKILLTFAEDGETYAAEVCRIFRRKRENCPKIGVLVLSEHTGTVNKDPQQFISAAFSQVDYVCPILTSGYFNLITKKQKMCTVSNIHIDALHVPYIFRLMNSYFVANDCLNDKVRCIIPEDEFSLVPVKYLWTNPIFGAWVKLCEVEELALRLLKSEGKNYC